EDGNMMAIDDVVQLLSIDLLGIVADSDDVITASNKGEPIAFQPNSTVSISYRNIARRILGENVPLQSLTEEKGFFKKLKGFFTTLIHVYSTIIDCSRCINRLYDSFTKRSDSV